MDTSFPQFRLVTVRNPSFDALVLRWALMPTIYPLTDLAFEIFRGQSPQGPWELLGEAEDGAYHYVDFDAKGFTSFRNYYYIVRMADKTGKGYRDSHPVVLEADPDGVAMGMVRKKIVYLRAKGGTPMAALLRKRWGAKCSRCWDEARKLAADAHCPLCFGTGFAGGFLKAIPIPAMQPQATLKAYQLIGDAKYQTDQTVFELANYPYLSPEDVLVDRVHNLRYQVERVEQRTHRGHIVSQLAVGTLLAESSPLYGLILPEHYETSVGRSFDMVKG